MPKEFNGREFKGIRWDFLEEAEEILCELINIFDLDSGKRMEQQEKKRAKELLSKKVSFEELFNQANTIYQEALRNPNFNNEGFYRIIYFFRKLLHESMFDMLLKKYSDDIAGVWSDTQAKLDFEFVNESVRGKAGLDQTPQPSQPEAAQED